MNRKILALLPILALCSMPMPARRRRDDEPLGERVPEELPPWMQPELPPMPTNTGELRGPFEMAAERVAVREAPPVRVPDPPHLYGVPPTHEVKGKRKGTRAERKRSRR